MTVHERPVQFHAMHIELTGLGKLVDGHILRLQQPDQTHNGSRVKLAKHVIKAAVQNNVMAGRRINASELLRILDGHGMRSVGTVVALVTIASALGLDPAIV